MAVLVDIRLRTIEDYITKKNGGRPRPTTPDEEDVVYRWTALMLAYIRNKWPVAPTGPGPTTKYWKN